MQPLTLYQGDNLAIMKTWPAESVDLVYLDPPFNSNRNFIQFDDRWAQGVSLERTATVLPETLQRLTGYIRAVHSQAMAAYIEYLAHRLLELHRLLQPAGSIYLHCDDTAVHYLKALMDAIFEPANYHNNIVWRRSVAHNDAKRYGRILDHILFYSKGPDSIWNGQAVAEGRGEEELRRTYSQQDYRGWYRVDGLTGPSHGAPRSSPSSMPWRNVDVHTIGRHWSVPRTGRYAEYIEKTFIPGYRAIKGVHDRLDALDEADLIHYPKQGKWPGLKRYSAADMGKPVQNLFDEALMITTLTSAGTGEGTGYPTQKPMALLERLIQASSNPGDLVLDPFFGSGTTLVTAEQLHRDWIGIDKAEAAVATATKRFAQMGMEVTCNIF